MLIVGAGGLGLWTLKIAEYAMGADSDRVRLTVADSSVSLRDCCIYLRRGEGGFNSGADPENL